MVPQKKPGKSLIENLSIISLPATYIQYNTCKYYLNDLIKVIDSLKSSYFFYLDMKTLKFCFRLSQIKWKRGNVYYKIFIIQNQELMCKIDYEEYNFFSSKQDQKISLIFWYYFWWFSLCSLNVWNILHSSSYSLWHSLATAFLFTLLLFHVY